MSCYLCKGPGGHGATPCDTCEAGWGRRITIKTTSNAVGTVTIKMDPAMPPRVYATKADGSLSADEVKAPTSIPKEAIERLESLFHWKMYEVQGIAAQDSIAAMMPAGPFDYGVPDYAPLLKEPYAPMLYDGLTAEQCLARFESNQCDGKLGWRGQFRMTPAQKQAASGLWSAQLRAKVETSKAAAEAREVSVVVDLEDV